MTSKIDGANRVGIAFPDQALTLADLAGEFNAMSLEGVDGELFWGQDRLDFLQRRLARG